MSPLFLQTTPPALKGAPVSSGAPLAHLLSHDMMLIILFALLIAGASALAVYYAHRSRRRHSSPLAPTPSIVFGPKRHHRHRRRKRKEHYPRNPTLAETGGLPAIKPPAPPQSTT